MAGDIFKKKSDDIFGQKNDDIFEKTKKSTEIERSRYSGDIFKKRHDIFESPGFQLQIFPDSNSNDNEPKIADILAWGKYHKNKCHAESIRRSLRLYFNDNAPAEAAVKNGTSKRVQIKEDWD